MPISPQFRLLDGLTRSADVVRYFPAGSKTKLLVLSAACIASVSSATPSPTAPKSLTLTTSAKRSLSERPVVLPVDVTVAVPLNSSVAVARLVIPPCWMISSSAAFTVVASVSWGIVLARRGSEE